MGNLGARTIQDASRTLPGVPRCNAAIIHAIEGQVTPVLTFFIGVWAGATIINLVWLRAASKGKL
jgi:hypothetical protein